MIIGGLFILLLTTGTIYFKIIPLFSAKQSSDTLPASEEILKPVVEEMEKVPEIVTEEISLHGRNRGRERKRKGRRNYH